MSGSISPDLPSLESVPPPTFWDRLTPLEISDVVYMYFGTVQYTFQSTSVTLAIEHRFRNRDVVFMSQYTKTRLYCQNDVLTGRVY